MELPTSRISIFYSSEYSFAYASGYLHRVKQCLSCLSVGKKKNGSSTFTDVILNATIVFERFYTCYTSQGVCFCHECYRAQNESCGHLVEEEGGVATQHFPEVLLQPKVEEFLINPAFITDSITRTTSSLVQSGFNCLAAKIINGGRI